MTVLQKVLSTRYLKIGREFVWVGIGQAASVIGSLVGLKVLTKMLGASEFGVLTLALTAPLLLGNFFFAGPGQAVMRFFSASLEAKQPCELMQAAWKTMWQRTVILVGLVVCVAILMWLTGQSQWWSMSAAALVYGGFTAFSTILDGMQNAVRQRAVVAWHAGLSQWLRLLFAVVLFLMLGASAAVAMWGYAIASIIVFSSQYWQYQRYRHHKLLTQAADHPDRITDWVRRINVYSWPFSVFGIFAWLQSSSERWGLGIIVNTAAAGQYAALAQIGLASMAILSNYLIQMAAPVLYSRAGDGRDHSRRAQADRINMMLLLAMFIVTLVILVGAGLFHREIFSILVAEDFRDVSALLPVAVLAGGLLGCGQVASFIVLTGTESHPLIIPKSATAIVTALAVLVGANLAGISGVIWANVAGAVFYLVLIFIVKSRKRTWCVLSL